MYKRCSDSAIWKVFENTVKSICIKYSSATECLTRDLLPEFSFYQLHELELASWWRCRSNRKSKWPRPSFQLRKTIRTRKKPCWSIRLWRNWRWTRAGDRNSDSAGRRNHRRPDGAVSSYRSESCVRMLGLFLDGWNWTASQAPNKASRTGTGRWSGTVETRRRSLNEIWMCRLKRLRFCCRRKELSKAKFSKN